MDELIPFEDRLRQILWDRKISIRKFCMDMGIDRGRFFYNKGCKHNRAYYMAIAYYLQTTVEELIDGTTALDAWYG